MVFGRYRHRWLRLKRATHLPRGIHRRQFLAALLSLALPLALIPLSRAVGADASGGSQLWQPAAAFPGGTVVRRVFTGLLGGQPALYAVSTSGGLLASLDAGTTWTFANTGLPQGRLRETRVLDVAVDPLHPGVMYAAVDSPAATQRPMLYWTVDGGLHWQPRANLGRERVRALAIGATSGDLYVVTSVDVRRAFLVETEEPPPTPQERFARDRDDLLYEIVATFDGATQATCVSVVEPPDGPAQVFVGTRGRGLLVLSPGGSAAEPYAPDAATRYVRQQASVAAVRALPGQAQRLCAGTERGLYLSADGGRTWSRAPGALGVQRIVCLYALPFSPETLLAGVAGAGVNWSRDAGANWERLGGGLGRAAVLDVALVDGGLASTLYAATDAGLWRLPLEPTR